MTDTDNKIRFDTDNQFPIIKLIEDAGATQFVREFTQNAIEAGATNIHWRTTRVGGVPKVTVIDDGVGMTDDELKRFMQTMACSGKTQGTRANYGVGAKLAGLRFSPAGVLVRSWRDGIGSEVLLRLRGEGDHRVAELVAFDDGTLVHATDDAPDGIDGHGTQVVFYGEDAETDTTIAPPYVGGGTMWVGRLLTTRYAHLPKVNITIEEHKGVKGGGSVTYDRKLLGQFDRLNDACEASGTVQLVVDVNRTPMKFKVRWWLADEARKMTGDKKTMMAFGHCGVLFDGELFDQYEGGPGTARLSSFGVTVGTGRVVLYVEPDVHGPYSPKTDLTRTHVDLQPGVQLPWGSLAKAFSEKMPRAIATMMRKVARADANAAALRQSIDAYLAEHRDLYGARQYRLPVTPRTPSNTNWHGTGSDKGNKRKPRNQGDVQTDLPLALPDYTWLFLADGSRDIEDGMEDRIARYDPTQHRVVINGDFRGIADLISQAHKAVPRVRKDTIIDATRHWVTIGLVEQIMSIIGMAGRSYRWDSDDIVAALCPEALTGGFYRLVSQTSGLIIDRITTTKAA